MSEIEHHRGKLVPIFVGLDLESCAMRLLKIASTDFDSRVYKSCLEQLMDDNYRKFFIVDDTIYLIEGESIDCDGDIASAKKLDNGEILFELRFHNGGITFDDMMEEAIKSEY